MALYDSRAVHVTARRTLQGTAAIQNWYQQLFNQFLPNAAYRLEEETGRLGSRQFSWTASSTAGRVTAGRDSFGLVDGKIVYHFTHFNIEPQSGN
jgi:hypothetical protein